MAGQERQGMEAKLLSSGSVTNPWWLALACKNRCSALWATVIRRGKITYSEGPIKETALSLVKEMMI